MVSAGRRLLDWRLWLAVAVAVALARVIAVPLPDALVIGAAVAVAGLVLPALGGGRDMDWPDPVTNPHHGRRVEVSRMTWLLAGRDGRVSEPGVRRIREVARARLARAGLPLSAGFDGPADARGQAERLAAQAALGPRAWSVLAAPSSRLPSVADVAVCVRALELILDEHPDRPDQPDQSDRLDHPAREDADDRT